VGIHLALMAFDGTNIWVANYGSNTLTKLQTSDGTVAGTFSVGANPIAFDGADIWVANVGGNRVTKLRARDGALFKTLSMCNPYAFAFDGANIRVTNPGCIR
jgi:DNA-binding beta-propeller fold protein YncE